MRPEELLGTTNEYGVTALYICEEQRQNELNSTNKNRTVYIRSKCNCGKEFDTNYRNFDRIKSCGCSRRRSKQDIEAEIGNTYGNLTIIGVDWNKTEKYIKKGSYQGPFYFCQCGCGSIPNKSYRLNSLRTGHIKSCGCSKINNPKIMHDLTGQKFGRLTVIGRDVERDSKRKKSGNVHWLCQCDCGNPKLSSVTGYQLETGHTRSCGCLVSEITAERNRINSPKTNKFGAYKSNETVGESDYIKIYGENGEDFCIVDKEDYEFLKQWFWRKDSKGYWVTNTKKNEMDIYGKYSLKMHQLIATRMYGEYDTKTLFPDHRSRDKSDNRRINLELKTNLENMRNRTLSKANTSGKTGVYKDTDSERWIASITVNYKAINLGRFKSFEEAVQARKEAEEKYGFTCDDVTAASNLIERS